MNPAHYAATRYDNQYAPRGLSNSHRYHYSYHGSWRCSMSFQINDEHLLITQVWAQ